MMPPTDRAKLLGPPALSGAAPEAWDCFTDVAFSAVQSGPCEIKEHSAWLPGRAALRLPALRLEAVDGLPETTENGALETRTLAGPRVQDYTANPVPRPVEALSAGARPIVRPVLVSSLAAPAPAMAGAQPGAQAEPVESLLPSVPQPVAVGFPLSAMAMPKLTLEAAAPAEFSAPPAVCDTFMPGLAAEPVASFVAPAASAVPIFALRLPQLTVEAAELFAPPAACDSFTPSLAAEPVTSFVAPVASVAPIFAVRPPQLTLEAVTPAEFSAPPAACDSFMPGLAAEPVASFVAPVASAAPIFAVRLPQLTIEAVEAAELFVPPAACDSFMPGLAAEPVANFVAPAASAAPIFAVRLPQLMLEAVTPAEFSAPPAVCDSFMPGLAAEPVASFVAPVASAAPIFAVRMPELRLDTAEHAGRIDSFAPPPVPENWIAAPAPETVDPIVDPAAASLPLPAPELPQFAIAPPPPAAPREGFVQPAATENWIAAPAAETVNPTAEPTAAPMASSGLLLPQLGLEAPAPSVPVQAFVPPAACEGWMPVPAAEAVARLVEAAAMAVPLPAPAARLALPAWELRIAGRFEAFVPPASEEFMPGAAAEPVARWLAPAVSGELPAAIAAETGSLEKIELGEPTLPVAAHFVKAPAAQAAEAPVEFAALVEELSWPAAAPLAALPQFSLATTEDGATKQDAPPLEPPVAAPLTPVESIPTVPAFAPSPAAMAPIVVLPQITTVQSAAGLSAGFEDPAPPAVAPAAGMPDSNQARLEPLPTFAAAAPEAQFEKPTPIIPRPGFIPLLFYSQRSVAAPSLTLEWQAPAVSPIAPRFALRPVFERLEELSTQKPDKKKPAFGEIFTMPEVAQRYERSAMRHVVKALAAGLIVSVGLWMGASGVKVARQMASATHVEPANPGSETNASSEGSPVYTAETRPAVAPGGKTAPQGTMSRIRRALAERAAVEVVDSFHNGMDSWATTTKTGTPAAASWARNPDGYVRPAELAFFRPSMKFSDYRLEFFGQIEARGMNWVVRAHDTSNYYAMKVKVVEPGLRPFISMVHYPVVDGKRGHAVETPLNVMVHNNRPFQVAVNVQGNHIVTSIDGEEVDSWTDDTIASGGVGFFTEAGERARLYWMKVSKNQDFVGRICAYLSGDTERTTAELWHQSPGNVPQPGPPPAHNEDVTLAGVQAGLFSFASTQRAGNLTKRRTERWSS